MARNYTVREVVASLEVLAREAEPSACRGRDRLLGIAVDPSVCGEGVFPEVFLRGGATLRVEILPHYSYDRRQVVHSPGIRPVAAEDQAVLSESLEQIIQGRPVHRRITYRLFPGNP